MRAERSWYYGVLAGAFAALAAFSAEARADSAIEVRYAWTNAAPALVSIAALLGLALAGWRRGAQPIGKVLAGAGMGALAAHLLLVLFVPLAPHESLASLVWPALDVLGWAALPATVIVATEPRTPPRAARGALVALALVAATLAARLLWNAFAQPEPMRVGVAVSWTSFVLAGGWAVLRLLSRLVDGPRADVSPQATPP